MLSEMKAIGITIDFNTLHSTDQEGRYLLKNKTKQTPNSSSSRVIEF